MQQDRYTGININGETVSSTFDDLKLLFNTQLLNAIEWQPRLSDMASTAWPKLDISQVKGHLATGAIKFSKLGSCDFAVGCYVGGIPVIAFRDAQVAGMMSRTSPNSKLSADQAARLQQFYMQFIYAGVPTVLNDALFIRTRQHRLHRLV